MSVVCYNCTQHHFELSDHALLPLLTPKLMFAQDTRSKRSGRISHFLVTLHRIPSRPLVDWR